MFEPLSCSKSCLLAETSDDACYRAMDWLLDIASDLEREVFWQVATLLDHEVDLLFFDTTSTYFELEDPDEPVDRDFSRGQPCGGGLLHSVCAAQRLI